VSYASRLLIVLATCAVALPWAAGDAQASPSVRFGVQDDAWLLYGSGTLESRISELDRLGVGIVRFTVRWDQVAKTRPATPRSHRDAAYDWSSADPVLEGLRRHGIAVVVTLYGTPRWANGGRTPNWVPTAGASFANFAHATASRYPWIRSWTIWNEPNQPRWFRPSSARLYVERLLNPAYAQIRATIRGSRVGGGMTSPRGGLSGISPVAWMRAMGVAKARLDAYAHHPYPTRPQLETPWGPGCAHCSSITMADLERLRREVRRNFGPKRIWLTEYGYQTNPPDRILGVSPALQARYVTSASRRAYLAPEVDMLIFFLVVDDSDSDGWQSGFFTAAGVEKPAHAAFRMPITQVARQGSRVILWGQIRGPSGAQSFRIRRFRNGNWAWVGGVHKTNAGGYYSVSVPALPGSVVRVWSPRVGFSLAVRTQ
jgi:hypothetical protein